MKRLLFAAALVGIIPLAVNAENWGRDDDRKAPPQLPKRERSCINVRHPPASDKVRCYPIAKAVLNSYELKSGDEVSVMFMFKLQDANEKYLKKQLR